MINPDILYVTYIVCEKKCTKDGSTKYILNQSHPGFRAEGSHSDHQGGLDSPNGKDTSWIMIAIYNWSLLIAIMIGATGIN